jgi:hypothetical protein
MAINKLPEIRIIVPHIKPKYKQAEEGIFVHMDGRWSFQSGNTTVYIKEHFPITGATPEKLIENTIRYDGENLSKPMANKADLCYTAPVNGVL